MVSFYAFPVIFVDTVTLRRHPNQKGGCPDTLGTPLDPPLRLNYRFGIVNCELKQVLTTCSVYICAENSLMCCTE